MPGATSRVLFAVAMGLGSCCAVSSTAGPAWARSRRAAPMEVEHWDVDPWRGFAILAMTGAPEFRIGTSHVVDGEPAWEQVWSEFGFRGARPQVDFREHRVVVYLEPAPCSGGGHGGQPVVALHLFDDGVLVPEFPSEPNGGLACEAAADEPRVTGYAYALSLPRRSVVAVRAVGWNQQRRLAHPAASASLCNECLETTHDRALSPTRASRVPPVDVRGSVPLPAVGQARQHVLSDGTPIWVVRHLDGSVTVLGAEHESVPEWLPGYHLRIRWIPAWRRFGVFGSAAWFDEWGTHASGTRPGLDRYASRVEEGRVFVEVRGMSAPPGPVARPRVPRPSERSTPRGRFDDAPALSVPAALAAPLGARVLVDGVLLLSRDGQPTLCTSPNLARGHWQSECAPVVDMFRPRDCSGAILDTFSVRRARDGFRHVVGDGLAPNYFCRTREGWRVPKWWGAPPEARWGARRLALALTAGAHGSYGVRRTLAGAELSVALRYRWGFWLDDPAEFWSPSSFWRSQIGQCFELALRGRMLGAIERGTSSGEWLLGVHPSFRSDLVFSRTATATLLGALVPEAGIARMQARTRPYIAWRFPFELRRLAPTERQYPIAFTDRVGFEVAPTLLLPLGVRPLPWSAGLSLGVTIW